MAIIGIGLQRDYYLDDEIPDYEWVEDISQKTLQNNLKGFLVICGLARANVELF